jgi:hypothetical protein
MDAAADVQSGGAAIPWHALPADDVVRRLHTDPVIGLEPSEASQRLERYGPSRLPEAKQRGSLVRLPPSSTTSCLRVISSWLR